MHCVCIQMHDGVLLACLKLQSDGFLSALGETSLLREAFTLSTLDLCENNVGDEGAAALAAALAAAGQGGRLVCAHSCGHAAVAQSVTVHMAVGRPVQQCGACEESVSCACGLWVLPPPRVLAAAPHITLKPLP